MILTSPLRKILVVNLGGMGDLLLSSASIRSLHNAYPEAKISLLVSSKAVEIARRLGFIDKVFVFYPQSLLWIALRGILLLWGLRRECFDLAVNMRTIASSLSALKARLLLGLINAKVTAGRNTQGRAGFLDISINESEYGDMYERDYDLALIEALGIKAVDKRLEFSVTAKEAATLAAILKEKGLKEGEILVGVHPGGEQSRRWPIKNYQELLGSLSSVQGVRFVITGTTKEAAQAVFLAAKFRQKAIDLCGALSLGELAALMKRSALYICNDTGSMHLAAAVGAPILVIFGGGSLIRFDPCQLNSLSCVLYKPVSCSPCNKAFCFSKKCLKEVTVQEAALQARRILKV
ncbi:MAG: glycosyltransferase family 9 protein [Candidatus Omnitrophota bacterium]|jgi:ADP-heptose:LPS heptosyltransferase